MKIWKGDDNWAMPFDSPAYPPLPGRYHDAVFQSVYFTTDVDNIAAILPNVLEPSDSGLCCAFGIDARFCATYGPFKEVGVVVSCRYEGSDAFFLPCLFLSSSDAISPGREIWGCPKKMATITMTQEGQELTTTAVRADIPFIQINSRITEPSNPEEIPPLWPMYLLKIIPSPGGQNPAVKQLVLNGELSDVNYTKVYKGPGVVSFRPTVAGDFWRLEPREFLGSFYQELSYAQGVGKVVKDLLSV